ncbi:MAG: hypothetical protein AABZ15_03395 [Nitrospirota bacterium]
MLGLVIFLAIISPGRVHAQYTVNGVVEFTYRHYETKIGDQHSSSSSFSQTYRAALSSFLFDPRFLRYTAGVGYNTVKVNNGSDSSSLDYNLAASFFPARKISWDLYGSKISTSYQGTQNLGGYDITTTTYGADLHLRLNQGKRQAINSNSNNNNNDSFSGSQRAPFPLPDISLSRSHTESETTSSSTNYLHEERDNTRATINYLYSSAVILNYDGRMENYKNLMDGSSYDKTDSFFNGNIRVSPSGKLNLDARVTDNKVRNITNYANKYGGESYNANLMFDDKRISQSYYVNYSDQYSDRDNLITERAGARVTYKMLPELSLYGGVDYGQSEFVRKATATTQAEKAREETGSLTVGALYSKLYTPEFLGPFGFRTSYGLSSGTTKYSGQLAGGRPEGTGRYYENNVTLGLASIGWKEETASLDYTYRNRRDDGPSENNVLSQRYSVFLSSKRVPRTYISLSGYYQTLEMTSFNSVFYAFSSNTNQTRTLNYTATVSHAATAELTLLAGAARGNTTSHITYSLSTLPSTAITQDDLYYAAANYAIMLTRSLSVRAEVREEYRRTFQYEIVTHSAHLGLEYRIRSIFMNLDYHWKQDAAEDNLRTTSQYYMAKLSRPF